MAEIVNLRRARKAKARSKSAKTASSNRVKYGVSKDARRSPEIEREKLRREMDSKKLDS